MEDLMEYRMLPAISTFPQFNRPMSILSPLDLSLRSSSVPITPPSTPSPPRKRTKLHDDHNIWRPHTINYVDAIPFLGHREETHTTLTSTKSPITASPKDDSEDHKHKSQVTGNATDGQSINLFDDETIVLTEDEKDTATDSNDDDEEYVDILGNDDEDDTTMPDKFFNPNSDDKINAQKALTRDKLVYEDQELHQKAMDGFAKLFLRDFRTGLPATQSDSSNNDERDSKIAATPDVAKSAKPEKRRFKMRKQLSVDEDNTSPVSGTIIRKLRDDEELVVRKGDIDPAFNVVEITEEAKAILASIDNKIGAYLCQLCRTLYDDAFQLAQHRCPRIVHIEYKCSECEKVFNCPANLASHKRWHKPKAEALGNVQSKKRISGDGDAMKVGDGIEEPTVEGIFNCNQCGKSFRRQAYLKKHLSSHQMLDDLKSMDSFKPTTNSFPHNSTNYMFHQANGIHSAQDHLHPATKTYPNPNVGARFSNLFTNFEQRRFHVLSDLYFSHQLDRSSAFHYVQNQNLCGLPISPMIPPLIQMPVK